MEVGVRTLVRPPHGAQHWLGVNASVSACAAGGNASVLAVTS